MFKQNDCLKHKTMNMIVEFIRDNNNTFTGEVIFLGNEHESMDIVRKFIMYGHHQKLRSDVFNYSDFYKVCNFQEGGEYDETK